MGTTPRKVRSSLPEIKRLPDDLYLFFYSRLFSNRALPTQAPCLGPHKLCTGNEEANTSPAETDDTKHRLEWKGLVRTTEVIHRVRGNLKPQRKLSSFFERQIAEGGSSQSHWGWDRNPQSCHRVQVHKQPAPPLKDGMLRDYDVTHQLSLLLMSNFEKKKSLYDPEDFSCPFEFLIFR